ncbi:MAG: two-component system OmpR family sensor kinase [Polaribacter sp.]|jgi:two-component system OmpR family sensor kinase
MQKLTSSLVIIVLIAVIGISWGIDQFFENYSDNYNRSSSSSNPSNLQENSESDIIGNYKLLGHQLANSINSISEPENFIKQWNKLNHNKISMINRADFPLPVELEKDFLAGESLVLESDNKLSLHFYLSRNQVVFSFTPNELSQDSPTSSLSIILTALFYFSVFILILLWSYPLVKRLNLLQQIAVKFGSGDLTQRIKLSKTSYISDIEIEFNRMAQRIESLVNDNKLISSAVSHDLRTPLARLRLGVDVLSESNDQNNRVKYQQRLSRDIDEMQSLIEVLLDYAKLEQSLIRQELKSIDLIQIISQCHDYYNTEENPIDFIKPTDSVEIVGDPKYLSLVFNNLLSNAIKFCEHKIIIEIVSNSQNCWVNIHDDGKGISKERQLDIFKPFIKFDSSSYGMGLAIVERITHWHKGEICVARSKLIGGAIFKVKLAINND